MSKPSCPLSKDTLHASPSDVRDEPVVPEQALMPLYNSALKNNDYQAALSLISLAEYGLVCEKDVASDGPTRGEDVLVSKEHVGSVGGVDKSQNKRNLKISRERKYFVSTVDDHHNRRKTVSFRGKRSRTKKSGAAESDGTLDKTQFDKESIALSEFSFMDEEDNLGEKKVTQSVENEVRDEGRDQNEVQNVIQEDVREDVQEDVQDEYDLIDCPPREKMTLRSRKVRNKPPKVQDEEAVLSKDADVDLQLKKKKGKEYRDRNKELRRFVCDVCDHVAFPTNVSLKSHKMIHTGERPFHCDQCDFKAATSQKLIIHKRRHSGEKRFGCDLCSFRTVTKCQLKSHLLLAHTTEKPFKCDLCPFSTKKQKHLNRHKHAVHADQMMFGCDQCDYQCKEKDQLKRHILNTHTDMLLPYACDQCPFRARGPSHLMSHQFIHDGEKPFSCDKCEYRSAWKNGLKAHQCTSEQKQPLEPPFDPAKTLFVCDECSFSTYHLATLTRHKERHEPTDFFYCDKCSFCSICSFVFF